MLETIGGLEACTKLGTLLLKNNHIGRNGLSDIMALTTYPTISCLDISNNNIEDPEALPEVFC
jgi:hypothetical protein